MKVDRFDWDKHGDAMFSWYEGHGWPSLPKAMFPTVGFVVEGLCAGWLYQSDSVVCWFEWIVSNPEAEKRQVHKALAELYDHAIIQSEELGYSSIFSSFNHKGLIRLAEKKGFQVTDTNMTNLVRTI